MKRAHSLGSVAALTACFLVSCSRGDADVPGGGAGPHTKVVSDARELSITLPGDVPLVLVRVPAGTFQMGSPVTERGHYLDETPHTVTLTRDYVLGKFQITQKQWKSLMGSNPVTGSAAGSTHPVFDVSWDDVAGPGGFFEKLNQHLSATGQAGAGAFRLPTEAERERAARAGTDTRFSFGDALECGDACEPCPTQDAHMWWCGNADGKPHPVGRKQPNAFGLHDMHGGLYDLCADTFDQIPEGAATDPAGPPSGALRVIKGGYFGSDASSCRSAYRTYIQSARRDYQVGFRVARFATP